MASEPSTPHESPYVRELGYAARYRDVRFRTGTGAATHGRESSAISELLEIATVPAGPWLDAPCGAGRLSGLLPETPVQVDRDPEMVAISGAPERVCARASELPFRDDTFAGALTMRLLHHVRTSDERVRILSEIRRVTRGPVVASFFHAVSLQHARRTVRRWFGRRNTGRCAVTWRQFRADLDAAGLRPVAWRAMRRFVSEQWIVLAERR